MTDKIKCPGCGISVPDVPEDATFDETLCNRCTEEFENDPIHFIPQEHQRKADQ